MVVHFSARSASPTTENALSRARRGISGPLLDLTVSNPTVVGLTRDDDALLAPLRRPEALTYAPRPFGLPPARRAVAEVLSAELGAPIAAERVVLCASTSEAYAFAFKLLCDPGDEVLVPQPGYPLLTWLATFEGVTPRPYRLYYDGEWGIDRFSLTAAIGPRTRAVLLVSPSNPLGAFSRRDDLEWLAGLGLPLLSDEVFAPYRLEPASDAALSVHGTAAPLVLRLDGLSKRAGLPQMKVGWMTLSGQDAAVDAALGRLELIADTWLSLSTPAQHALPDWLRVGQGTEGAIQRRLAQNLDLLRAEVSGSAVDVPRVEGGWYACLRLPAVREEEQWVLELLGAGVWVQPGWLFDIDSGCWVIVSLLTPEDVFREGIARLMARVAAII